MTITSRPAPIYYSGHLTLVSLQPFDGAPLLQEAHPPRQILRGYCAAPMALRVAADEEQQFTMHAVVDTHRRFIELLVVYTKNPSLGGALHPYRVQPCPRLPLLPGHKALRTFH